METLSKRYAEHKQALLYSLGFTFFWGLLAHSYCFFEYSFSHDSLMELHGYIFGNDWKISLGRVFVPFYRDLFRSDATLPWLIGVLSLLWIGLSVFLTVRILDIRSKLLVCLTAGIFTTNISVSATAATYLHDLDCYMFSLLCAVAAVDCWKNCKWGIIPGAILLTGSLGMYQGFLSVAIALVMFVCILRLLEGDTFLAVFKKGLQAVAMILASGFLYIVSMKVIQTMSGVQMQSGSYNSVDKIWQLRQSIPMLVSLAYQDWFTRLVNAVNAYPSILIKGTVSLLAAVSVAVLTIGLTENQEGIWGRLLCIVLLLLMPLGMNLIYILNQGLVHDLMMFAIWMSYLFALRLCQWLVEWLERKQWSAKWPFHRWAGWIVAFLVVLMVYGNVQFANGMYLKKDLEKDAYISYMTRVVGQIETQEGYITGQTPLCFVGEPKNLYSPQGFSEYTFVIGMEKADLLWVNSRDRYENLFGYLLGVPVMLADEPTWNMLQHNGEVAEMPCYPDMGSIKMVGDILVVKLGD